MSRNDFLKRILKWMDEHEAVMSDTFIIFPSGEKLTFGDVWMQIIENRDYGGRCLTIYEEMFV